MTHMTRREFRAATADPVLRISQIIIQPVLVEVGATSVTPVQPVQPTAVTVDQAVEVMRQLVDGDPEQLAEWAQQLGESRRAALNDASPDPSLRVDECS